MDRGVEKNSQVRRSFLGSARLWCALVLAFKGAVVTHPAQATLGDFIDDATRMAGRIDHYLTPPRASCDVHLTSAEMTRQMEVDLLDISKRLLLAARTTMAMQYQSCRAPFLPPVAPVTEVSGRLETLIPNTDRVVRSITDVAEYERTHPILSRLPADPAPGCRDISAAPPMYLYGSKPAISPGPPPSAFLFTDQSRSSLCIDSSGNGYNGAACATDSNHPVSGMDCTGFTSLLFMHSGLRVTRDRNPSLLNTSQLVSAARSRSSCLAPVSWESQPQNLPTLETGDIYVMAGNHAVMIESSGPDPFGIGRLPPDTPCEGLTPADWDFRIIHSSSRGGAAGITVMNASEFFLDASEFAGPLILQAQRACEAYRASRALREGSDPPPMRAPILTMGERRSTIESTLRSNTLLLRHRGDAMPGCETPEKERLQFQHQGCIEGCDLLPERSSR